MENDAELLVSQSQKAGITSIRVQKVKQNKQFGKGKLVLTFKLPQVDIFVQYDVRLL